MGLIVLCFAQAGSRVSLTGGPYAYVETALGPYVGFLAGVLLWLLSLLATAAVASAFAGSLTAFVPSLGSSIARIAILAVLFGSIVWLNVRGTREGTRLVEIITIAKLLPLILFVVAGAFAASRGNTTSLVAAPASIGRSVIVLFFAFAGIESALVPSGEVKDPARTVPRALFIAMIAVTLLYVCIQMVAWKLLGPSLATEQQAPLVTAARVSIGATGALVIALGASISMFGHVSGMMLATPRTLYAFGRDGIIPPVFARVNERTHTPSVAIATQGVLTFLLAATSGFTKLAILANVAVLTLYLLCCIAAWQLARRDVRAGGTPFQVPGGAFVPWLAVAVIVAILANATLRELCTVAAVLVVASALFFARVARNGYPAV